MYTMYPLRYPWIALGGFCLGVSVVLGTPLPAVPASDTTAGGVLGNPRSVSDLFGSRGIRSKGAAEGTTGLFGHAKPGGLLEFLRGPGETRQPSGAPPLPGQSGQQGQPPTGLVLTGVVIVGDRALGFVQDPVLTSNKVVMVREGDTLGPYTISSIEADRMSVSSPGGAFTVRLSRPTGPAGSTTSNAAPSRSSAGQPSPQGGAQGNPAGTGVKPQ